MLVGSIVGVSLGALVGAALRIKVEAKTAILITLSLACCFLAGLMVEGISLSLIHICGVNIMGAPRKRFKTAGAVWAAILRKRLGKQALYEKAQKA